MPDASPFRTWNGRDAWEFVDGVHLHAIGGEQVLLCRVTYAPGKQVPWHAHPESEQVMVVLAARLVGRPGRLAGLARFLDHVAKHDRVWISAVSNRPISLAMSPG